MGTTGGASGAGLAAGVTGEAVVAVCAGAVGTGATAGAGVAGGGVCGAVGAEYAGAAVWVGFTGAGSCCAGAVNDALDIAAASWAIAAASSGACTFKVNSDMNMTSLIIFTELVFTVRACFKEKIFR